LVTSFVAQHALDLGLVRRAERLGATQLTLALGRHLREDMTLVCVFALVTVAGFLKRFDAPLCTFTLGILPDSAFHVTATLWK
jgi:hypothetical protein